MSDGQQLVHFKTLNDCTGLDNEYGVVLVVLVVVLVVLGAVFQILVALVACNHFFYHLNHPQGHQNHYQDHQDHPCTSLTVFLAPTAFCASFFSFGRVFWGGGREFGRFLLVGFWRGGFGCDWGFWERC